MTLLPLSLLFAGCTPQDAEVEADFAVYLAASSSENINRLERTGTDVEGDPGDLGLVPIDCRDLSGLTEEAIADARLAGVDYAAECCESGSAEDCQNATEPLWFGWLDDYAYYLTEGKVDPWRTEAVLTKEGDLQLTVHMDFPKLGDFRFGWVIDPDFQPVECRDGEGGSEEVPVDGDWLAGWSAAEEKGTLYHLNAGAFQTNPSNTADYWSIEQEWQAGATFARFGDEEFYSHPIDYVDEAQQPFYVNSYAGPTAGYTGLPKPRTGYDAWVTNVESFFTDEVKDLETLGKSSFPLEMKIENNNWRPADDVASGFDGWLGVSPSWVRVDNPGDIKAKNDVPITGEFQIYLEGLAAASKVLVRGTFSIDHIREDVWGFDQGTLEQVKAEENKTPACGEERLTSVED